MGGKLFYEDQYRKEFTSAVLSCEAAEDSRWGAVFHVVLEATAFYPLGGGQPGDTGSLVVSRERRVRVLHTCESKGEAAVVHITDAPIDAGTTVTGRIDWERRFLLMQQHTGEHIVSGLALTLFGCHNVGFHMGGAVTTMDIDAVLTPEQLKELETLANRAVQENVAVCSRYPDEDELARMDYRSKKALTGAVRIVTVEGYDRCACCGLHCARTGEVGVVKIVQAQKYKSGMRFTLLCGMRGVEDYQQKNSDVYALSQLFSAKPDEVVAAARLCYAENAELKRQLAAYRFEALTARAEKLPPSRKALLFEDGLSPDELRRLCLWLCERFEIAAVFSGADEEYRYAFGSLHEDMRELGKHMNDALNGRGGGQKNLVQGTVHASRAAAEAFFDGV